MEPLAFRKMHGLGNDFAVFDGRGGGFALPPALVRAIADRRRGVGCDQVIVLEPPRTDDADVFMRIHNADGSEASACGNATRCIARWLLAERGDAGPVRIATRAETLRCWAEGDAIAADMGEPAFGWQAIPLAQPGDTAALAVPEAPALGPGMAVNVGNPHIVFFVDAPGQVPLAELGPAVERAPLFPAGVNVSLAAVTGPSHLAVRVWERGAGETLACGTAACASAVAALRAGKLAGPRVAVALPGGTLDIAWLGDNHIAMVGGTALVFDGRLSAAFQAAATAA